MPERQRMRNNGDIYTTLVERGNDGFVVIQDGLLKFANPRILEITGFSSEDVIGMPFINFIAASSRDKAARNYQKRMAGEAVPARYELYIMARDGRTIPVEMNASIITYEGRPADMAIVRDVTERRLAEQKLRESMERFRMLAENAQDIIFRYRLTPKPGFEYVSPSVTRITGYTPEEHYADPEMMLRVVHPDDRDKVAYGLANPESIPRLPPPIRWIRKDGQVIWVEQVNAFLRDDRGTPVAFEGIARDVTERVRMEQRLREGDERLRLALESAGDGVWDWNPQTNRVYFSSQWKSILGYGEDEIGDTLDEWSSRLHPDDRAYVYAELEKHLDGRTPRYLSEHRLRCKDGSYKWVLDRGKVITRDPDGKPVRVVGTHSDITDRKKLEQLLRQSEENFRRSLDESPLGISIVSTEGETLYANQALLDICGYRTIDELKESPTREQLYPRSQLTLWTELGEGPHGRHDSQRHDLSIVRADGQVRWLEVYRSELPWDGERRVQLVYHDITGRRKAEQEKAHLESLLRAIRNVNQLITREHDRRRLLNGCCGILQGVTEHATVWIALLKAGRVSVAAESGLGKGLPLLEQFMEAGALPACARRALGSPDPIFIPAGNNTECHDCPLGTTYAAKGKVAIRLAHGDRVLGIMAIAGEEAFLSGSEGLDLVREVADDIAFALHGIEIEEQNRRVSQEVQEAEARYRDLFENAPIPYYSIDMNGIITECNRAGSRWLGYEPGELLGKHRLELYAPEARAKAETLFEEYYRAGRPVTDEEMTFATKDGQTVYGLLSAIPLKDAEGNVIGVRGVVKDITEQRKMQQQLMMQDRLASIGELVSGVAHEVNNPLTGIIGFSEMLLSRQLPEDVRTDIRTILDESNRIAGIVRNLLTFTRKQPLEKSPVDVNQVIERVLNMRSYEMNLSNIKLATDLAADLASVMANASQLQQVFLNLVINAEYFMKEAHGGGTLTITTRNFADLVRVSFSDDGPGISPENMRHLFNPFFTTKPEGKGTGLGLSISRGIVEEHGGRIYVDSQPGRGATFVIELPAAN